MKKFIFFILILFFASSCFSKNIETVKFNNGKEWKKNVVETGLSLFDHMYENCLQNKASCDFYIQGFWDGYAVDKSCSILPQDLADLFKIEYRKTRKNYKNLPSPFFLSDTLANIMNRYCEH